MIDVRTISENGPTVSFVANDSEKKELEQRYDIPTIKELHVEGNFYRDDVILFKGNMFIEAQRICGTTLEPFTDKQTWSLSLLFSEENLEDRDDIDEDVFQIQKGKINLFDVFSEVLGLNLNPFPKSVDTFLDYQDPTDEIKDNPFSILEKLKK